MLNMAVFLCVRPEAVRMSVRPPCSCVRSSPVFTTLNCQLHTSYLIGTGTTFSKGDFIGGSGQKLNSPLLMSGRHCWG